MGYKKPDDVYPHQWQAMHPYVKSQHENRWRVKGVCGDCDLHATVRLDVLRRLYGDRFSLWGQTMRCPRWTCRGRMRLICYIPRVDRGLDMSAFKVVPPGTEPAGLEVFDRGRVATGEHSVALAPELRKVEE